MGGKSECTYQVTEEQKTEGRGKHWRTVLDHSEKRLAAEEESEREGERKKKINNT